MARRPASEQGDTVGDILNAAFGLFGRYGYDGVSMADVAKRSGVKKASLYYHFPSKEALYVGCHSRLHALFDEIVFAPSREISGTTARFLTLFAGVQTLIRHPLLSHGIAGYWLVPSTADLPEVESEQEAFTARATAEIASIMRAGLEAGEMDYDGDVDAMARSVWAVIEVLALPLQGSNPDEVRSVVDHLGGTFIRAYLRH